MEAKEKSKTAFMGKVPRFVTVDCCSDMVLATPWVQLLPWSWTGGRLAYKGSYSAIADVLTPCCCLSPGSVKGGILLLPQCTAVTLARMCCIWLEIVSHFGHLELFAKEFGGKLGNVSLSSKAGGQLGNVSR